MPAGILSVTNTGIVHTSNNAISAFPLGGLSSPTITTSAPLFTVDGVGSQLNVDAGLLRAADFTTVRSLEGVLQITAGGSATIGGSVAALGNGSNLNRDRGELSLAPLITVQGNGGVPSPCPPSCNLSAGRIASIDGTPAPADMTAGGLLRLTNGAAAETTGPTFLRNGRLVTVSATVSAPVFQVDASLLNAATTILEMDNSTVISGNLLQVNNAGTVSAAGNFVTLSTASTMTVTGHFLNVNGPGSTVTITGNLLALNTGSTLNINNGALVNVSNGGSFSLTGFLAVLPPGNTLNITNNLCAGGCPLLAGVPVLFANGGLLTNVTIGAAPPPSTSPYTAFSGGTATLIGTPAVIVVDGPTSTVRLGGF